MAYHQSTILLAALLFITTASIAHGYSIGGVLIAKVKITGFLYCNVDGNLVNNCPPLNGVTVIVSCDGGLTSLAQAVTDSTGCFRLDVNSLLNYDPAVCKVVVKLPIVSATCVGVLPPSGILQASISVINVVKDLLLGTVANCGCGSFSPLPLP